MLQAIPLVVIKLVQIGVILKMAGFLDHVFPVLRGGVRTGGEFKQIHVLRQAADLAGVFRLGHAYCCPQLLAVMNRKLLHNQRQLIEFVDVIAPEVQCYIHFLRK